MEINKTHPDNDKQKTMTIFEDLSNEIIYEIFELIDYYDLYQTFSNLNQRFYNIILHSQLPIHINLSSISKTNFQQYYTYHILPNVRRIKSLNLSNLFIMNTFLSSIDTLSNFIRLETIILKNLEPSSPNFLKHLRNLPTLFSLVIICHDNIPDHHIYYYQILRLPTLKSYKISCGYSNKLVSLSYANNRYSSIQSLVLDHNVHIDLLYSILSYVPELRRLSIDSLCETNRDQSKQCPIILHHLTYLCFRMCSISFENFESFVEKCCFNLRSLSLSIKNNQNYFDANRWENLILYQMPNLIIFDLQFIYPFDKDESLLSMYNKFLSSFWLEKQWFFAKQYPCARYQNNIIFYSTNPYRRKNFKLYGIIPDTDNFHSVNHLSIESIRALINCTNYFSNTTQLTFTENFDTISDSIGIYIRKILPVEQITRLVIDYPSLSFHQLIQFLNVMSNIQTLKLKTILFKNSFQQDEISNFVSIKRMIFESECPLEIFQLLLSLCPQLEYLTIDKSIIACLSMARLLLKKMNHNLIGLCILNLDKILVKKKLKMIIQKEKLFDHCSIIFTNHKVYFWW